MAEERVKILDVGVSAVDIPRTLSIVSQHVTERKQIYVCVTGVHGIIESQSDAALKQIHNNAGLVTPDGMPLVWMARWLGYDQIKRVYGPDLMLAITALSAQRGYRQFYYGGLPGVPEKLRSILASQFPGLQVCGTMSPPFKPLTREEDDEIITQINLTKPDIVWVGLSTPKQERWMAAHLGRIDAPVMIGVGAAFDFLSGTKRQAPAWMQENGLEWLFRLTTEPRRLWKRYLHIVPRFLVLAAIQLLFLPATRKVTSVSSPPSGPE